MLQNVPKTELLRRIGWNSHSWIRHPSTRKIQSLSSRKTPTRPKYVGNTSLRLTPTANPQRDFQNPSPWQGRYPTRPVHHQNIPSLHTCHLPLHITRPQQNTPQTSQSNYRHSNKIRYVNGLLTYQPWRRHSLSRQWHDLQNSFRRSIPRPSPSKSLNIRHLSLSMERQ